MKQGMRLSLPMGILPAIALLMLALPVQAEGVYKCTVDGKTRFQGQPCAEGQGEEVRLPVTAMDRDSGLRKELADESGSGVRLFTPADANASVDVRFAALEQGLERLDKKATACESALESAGGIDGCGDFVMHNRVAMPDIRDYIELHGVVFESAMSTEQIRTVNERLAHIEQVQRATQALIDPQEGSGEQVVEEQVAEPQIAAPPAGSTQPRNSMGAQSDSPRPSQYLGEDETGFEYDLDADPDAP
jgi:hypothetical protein